MRAVGRVERNQRAERGQIPRAGNKCRFRLHTSSLSPVRANKAGPVRNCSKVRIGEEPGAGILGTRRRIVVPGHVPLVVSRCRSMWTKER